MWEDFMITQAISTILLLLRNKQRAKKWTPAIRKLRDACIAIVGDE